MNFVRLLIRAAFLLTSSAIATNVPYNFWTPLNYRPTTPRTAYNPVPKVLHDDSWEPSYIYTDMHKIREDAIKVVMPITNAFDKNDVIGNVNDDGITEKNPSETTENATISSDNETTPAESNRKERQPASTRQYRKLTSEPQEKEKNTKTSSAESRRYEVYENDNSLFDTKNINVDAEKYFYEVPKTPLNHKLEPTTDNEYTNILTGILDKYNIDDASKLSNYVLSRYREQKSNPIANRVFIMQLPVFISDGIQAKNPLLSVILSNNGYYIRPYKIHREFREFHGTPLFNPLYNNAPFGEYKTYPDTDLSQ